MAERRPEEVRVTEREDATIGGRDPVAAPRGRRSDPDGATGCPGRIAEAAGAAVGRDPTARTEQPIPGPGAVGSYVDPRPTLRVRPVERGAAVVEDAAVAREEPVAIALRARRHADDGRTQAQRSRRAKEAGPTEGEDPAVRRSE